MKKRPSNLTQQALKERLRYEPKTGHFYRLRSRVRTDLVGLRTGSLTKEKNGAAKKVEIFIDDRNYAAHRLAWLYMTGVWPTTGIDHINGNAHDNRWRNLRLANQHQNIGNSVKRRKPSTSKYKGVHRDKKTKKWVSMIQHKVLGYFAFEEDAAICYNYHAAHIFGEYARLNSIDIYRHD